MINILEKIKNYITQMSKEEDKIIDIHEEKVGYEDELLSEYGECKRIDKLNLKILFIADTHNCLTYNNEIIDYIKSIKDYDCCILLGDHSANDLVEILNVIPREKIYGVLGNHDSWNKYEEYGINNIDGRVVTVKGVRIAGISGSFKYKNSDKYALYTHEESIKIANEMENADILITHDRAFTIESNDITHDGLKGITQYIYKNNIPLHIHGHIHEAKREMLKNGTISISLYKAKLLQL